MFSHEPGDDKPARKVSKHVNCTPGSKCGTGMDFARTQLKCSEKSCEMKSSSTLQVLGWLI